jgi:glycine dehydrogenase
MTMTSAQANIDTSIQRSANHGHDLKHPDRFARRHIGPDAQDAAAMLAAIGCANIGQLIDEVVPAAIRTHKPLSLPPARSEAEALASLRSIAAGNRRCRSYLGMGYHGCFVPAVIQRNILENPGWYTQYTPYQAEIAQGRLESLLNFQTMVADLTGLAIANASMLDEATAAAEAMTMCFGIAGDHSTVFYVADDCHPQTISVVKTRAEPLGITVTVAPPSRFTGPCFGILLQYPATDGRIEDYRSVIADAHGKQALAIVATDLMALTLLVPPGEFGADVAVGNSQRFGVPLGFGGPHAAFFATKEDFKRHLPGRLVGVSKDSHGAPALRLSLQTREQHIRREKATSNICTAQALLANMAAMYAVYHGPDGLRAIAERLHTLTVALADGLRLFGYAVTAQPYFDTVRLDIASARATELIAAAEKQGINLRRLNEGSIVIALDETTSPEDIDELLRLFADKQLTVSATQLAARGKTQIAAPFARTSQFLTHAVFNRYHSETEMLRYLRHLESRDLSLTHSMIPLGSCTMKLNASSEMLPVSWPEFAEIHPYAPAAQCRGYDVLFRQLQDWLAEITGFAAVSLQPNAGSQGEYAGLLAIRRYHASRGQAARTVCLIPTSAHGTNPASAAMVGMRVVAVACDSNGNVDLADLRAKAEAHAADLSCLMITYPSTHGVFEEGIRQVCDIVHTHGGQVYMDGANMNAQVGLCSPGAIGADVCHLNLHKTFCIPHGGGGPGMGPIGVASHLIPFLPGNPLGGEGAVSAAPSGSASILPISWMYIAMMGPDGLTDATAIAILNANYVAARLAHYYPVLYRGSRGRVAHECILDLRPLKTQSGIEVEDVAKRLMDYGFHAPTMSFPVPGTMMVEPTESESKEELDRFCDAMIAIHAEIEAVRSGAADRADNVLKHAPHTATAVIADDWKHRYTREQAAFPAPWTRTHKFWPAVGRVDNAYGDRNLVCSCVGMDAYR